MNTDDFDSVQPSGGLEEIMKGKIHIKHRQRNNRKGWTIVENLLDTYIKEDDEEALLKKLKKSLACSGTIFEAQDGDGRYIQFQGDHREEIFKFLIKCKITDKDNIEVHA